MALETWTDKRPQPHPVVTRWQFTPERYSLLGFEKNHHEARPGSLHPVTPCIWNTGTKPLVLKGVKQSLTGTWVWWGWMATGPCLGKLGFAMMKEWISINEFLRSVSLGGACFWGSVLSKSLWWQYISQTATLATSEFARNYFRTWCNRTTLTQWRHTKMVGSTMCCTSVILD